jgi:hypothetical protein
MTTDSEDQDWTYAGLIAAGVLGLGAFLWWRERKRDDGIFRGLRFSSMGEVYATRPDEVHFTEDDHRPFKMVEDRGTGRRMMKLRRGCRLNKTILCKKRAVKEWGL